MPISTTSFGSGLPSARIDKMYGKPDQHKIGSYTSMRYLLRLLSIWIPVAHVTCGVGLPSTTHSNSKPTLLSGKSTLPSGSILIILAGILPLIWVSDKIARILY